MYAERHERDGSAAIIGFRNASHHQVKIERFHELPGVAAGLLTPIGNRHRPAIAAGQQLSLRAAESQ